MTIPELPGPPDRRVVEGLAAVDRYVDSGDEADLLDAVRAFTEGYSVAPDGPDRLVSLHWLSRTCAESADIRGRVVDYDRAIDWTHRLLAALDAADPDRDDAVVRLVDLHWDRWIALPAAAREGELVGLVANIAAQSVSDADAAAVHYLALMHGLALHARVDAGLADELDTVVALLERALSGLLAEEGGQVREWVGEGRLATANLALAESYRRRADRDDGMADLDRAVDLLRDATGWYRAEPEVRTALCRGLAVAHDHRRRARADDDPKAADDLASAIDACAAAGIDDEPWFDAFHGELRWARAEATGDAAEARFAAELLARSAEATAANPDNWLVQHSAAIAYRSVWRLADDLSALEQAANHLDRALAGDVADHQHLLQLHADRLVAERDLIEAGLLRPPVGPSLMRGLVTAAHEAFDMAVRADPNHRAVFAGLLAFAELTAVKADFGELDAVRIRGLLGLAATARDPNADWRPFLDGCAVILGTLVNIRDPRSTVDGGAARLSRLAEWAPDLGRDLSGLVGVTNHVRATATGERRRNRAAQRQMDPPPTSAGLLRASVSGWSRSPEETHTMRTYWQVLERLDARDTAGASAIAEAALPVLQNTASSTFDEPFLAILRAVSAIGDPLTSVPLSLPDLPTGEGFAAVAQVAAGLVTAGGALAQAAARGDLARLQEATERIEAMVAHLPPTDRRLTCGSLYLTALAHLELARRKPGVERHVRTARRLGERAMDVAGGPHFPLWPRLSMLTAEAERLSADPHLPRTRELGISALQGHAWQVFVQAGTDDAIASARSAAADARRVTRWCLADRLVEPDADEQLVAALDGGRGLVLRTTTATRMVADQLVERNRPDLAARWRANLSEERDMGAAMATAGVGAGIEVPDDVRTTVLHALGGQRVVGHEPVTTADIRTALGGTGFDALAYLLAGEHGLPGVAVIVPAVGRTIVLDLPRLHLGPQSPVRRYIAAQVRAGSPPDLADPARHHGPKDRDLGPVDRLTGGGAGLDELCAWAWEAAMGSLLSAVEGWGLRRAARLVLVPMGALGLVPWHAAANTSRGDRYAVHDAVVSYSPSARALCEIDPSAPAPVTSALVIGDPTGDLPYAGAEARAVQRAFYPDGLFLGRAGTPDDVLDWVGSRPAGPAALHLACHGWVDPRYPADAHLILAGHAPLTVHGLLERSRSAALDLEQVFLAACTTSVSGDDHDEVLSLATAFRAAGARTVYGSLWPVPDGDTSLLMFLVHRYLRVDGCLPVDALHRAQLWMLDPEREMPGGLPEELQAQHRPGAPFAVASWAGFIHTGR
jgi:hypothetical protein